MQVVLRHDVDNLGLRGELVSVARGYARNYLLPRGLAELATPGLVAELERREVQRARHQAHNVDEATAIVARIEAAELRFEVKAGPTGSLFGSVTATTVADALWESEKIRIDRRKLELEPIKRIGRYTAPVEVFSGVTAELHLLVLPEGGVLPPEEDDSPADGSVEPEAEVADEVVAETTLEPRAETVVADAADDEAPSAFEQADAGQDDAG